MMGQYNLKQVAQFKYLGAILTNNNNKHHKTKGQSMAAHEGLIVILAARKLNKAKRKNIVVWIPTMFCLTNTPHTILWVPNVDVHAGFVQTG